MIDPATGWFEIVRVPAKRADTMAKLVGTTLVNEMSMARKMVIVRGTEFMAEVKGLKIDTA
jgi:hypothetical protein